MNLGSGYGYGLGGGGMGAGLFSSLGHHWFLPYGRPLDSAGRLIHYPQYPVILSELYPVRRRPLGEFWRQELNCPRRRGIMKAKDNVARCDRRLALKRLQGGKRKADRDKVRAERLARTRERKELNITRGGVKYPGLRSITCRRGNFSSPDPCPLYTCTRPKGLRRHRYQGGSPSRTYKRFRSRPSSSSDFSHRSRTPILTLKSTSPPTFNMVKKFQN